MIANFLKYPVSAVILHFYFDLNFNVHHVSVTAATY